MSIVLSTVPGSSAAVGIIGSADWNDDKSAPLRWNFLVFNGFLAFAVFTAHCCRIQSRLKTPNNSFAADQYVAERQSSMRPTGAKAFGAKRHLVTNRPPRPDRRSLHLKCGCQEAHEEPSGNTCNHGTQHFQEFPANPEPADTLWHSRPVGNELLVERQHRLLQAQVGTGNQEWKSQKQLHH